MRRPFFALGLLNRKSIFYGQKAGTGAYRGAHWHTAEEVWALVSDLPVKDFELKNKVFLPGGAQPLCGMRVEAQPVVENFRDLLAESEFVHHHLP